jgi:PhzF family phenazine biosynthesis protein
VALVKVKQVDVFTSTPLSGNSAGVVLEGSALLPEQMQAIAKELGMPEVSFVLSVDKNNSDIELCCFNSTGEIRGVGFSSLASVQCLLESKLLELNDNRDCLLNIRTSTQSFPVRIVQENGSIKIMVHFSPHPYERKSEYKVDLVRLLNITIGDFDSELTIQKGSVLLVPLRRLFTIYNMKPNYAAIGNFLFTRKLDGIFVYTLETLERGHAFHGRCFSANYVNSEEPVTMSAYIPLSSYLLEKGCLEVTNDVCKFIGEQGDEMGRRGRIFGEIILGNGKPEIVKLGGYAVTVMEGELLLPD